MKIKPIYQKGVCHGDDAYLVLGNEVITPVNSKRDLAMLKDLIKMWTSVAYNKYELRLKYNDSSVGWVTV